MRKQHFEESNDKIRARFSELKKAISEKAQRSDQAFVEQLGIRQRVACGIGRRGWRKANVPYIELHGNHYGPDLGYKVKETLKILADHGLKVFGCVRHVFGR